LQAAFVRKRFEKKKKFTSDMIILVKLITSPRLTQFLGPVDDFAKKRALAIFLCAS